LTSSVAEPGGLAASTASRRLGSSRTGYGAGIASTRDQPCHCGGQDENYSLDNKAKMKNRGDMQSPSLFMQSRRNHQVVKVYATMPFSRGSFRGISTKTCDLFSAI
jgi:hypothetical protein